MTHKHIKFKRGQDGKYYETKTFKINDEPHKERSRRALLLSSEDVDRMANERSRARLMMQLVSKPETTSREFGSYFRGQKNVSNPVYVMTSHTSATPIPKRIVPAYSSLVQGLEWSASKKDYSEDNQTDTDEDDSNYTCKCHKSKATHCLGRCLKTESIHMCLGDNIMKFSDNSTMTPKLTDTGCGACSSLNPKPINSQVSTATSEKDHSLVLHQTCPMIPVPILKKTDYRSNVCQNIENNIKPRVTRVTVHKAVRDNNCDDSDDDYFNHHIEDSAPPPCPNNTDNSSDCEYVRKVIYNEGISDFIKKNIQSRYPVTKLPPMRLQSPNNIKRNFSKVSIMSNYIDKETTIPYAHRLHSKYHSDCKPSFTKSYRCEIEEDNNNNIHRIENPLVFRRTQMSKAIRCTREPSIRLPKKVLTSERDIEAFVDKRKSKK